VHAGDIVTQAEGSKLMKLVPERHLDCPCTAFVTKTRSAAHCIPRAKSDAVHAGDIVTQAESSKLMKVVPERHLDCPFTPFMMRTN